MWVEIVLMARRLVIGHRLACFVSHATAVSPDYTVTLDASTSDVSTVNNKKYTHKRPEVVRTHKRNKRQRKKNLFFRSHKLRSSLHQNRLNRAESHASICAIFLSFTEHTRSVTASLVQGFIPAFLLYRIHFVCASGLLCLERHDHVIPRCKGQTRQVELNIRNFLCSCMTLLVKTALH